MGGYLVGRKYFELNWNLFWLNIFKNKYEIQARINFLKYIEIILIQQLWINSKYFICYKWLFCMIWLLQYVFKGILHHCHEIFWNVARLQCSLIVIVIVQGSSLMSVAIFIKIGIVIKNYLQKNKDVGLIFYSNKSCKSYCHQKFSAFISF